MCMSEALGRPLHLQRSTGGSGVVKVDWHILKLSICTVVLAIVKRERERDQLCVSIEWEENFLTPDQWKRST